MTIVPLQPAVSNRRLELADLLAQQGSSTDPAFGTGNALLRVAQGALGGFQRRREEDRIQAEEEQRREALIRALGGGGAPTGRGTAVAGQGAPSGTSVGGFAGGSFELGDMGGGSGNDDLAGVLSQGPTMRRVSSGPLGSQRTALPGLTGDVVGRTPQGRPMVRNEDGSFSTERSITVEIDGQFYNIPSMFNGRQVSDQEAVDIVRRNGFVDPETGRRLQPFQDLNSALSAAQARSSSIPNPSQASLPLPRQGSDLASIMAALPTPVLEQVAAQRAVDRLNPQTTRGVRLGRGDTLVDPTTGRTIAQGQAPEAPSFVRTARELGLTPDETRALWVQSQQPARNTTNVTVPPSIGEAPSGFAFVTDAGGNLVRDSQGIPQLQAIPGGDAALEQEAAAAAAEMRTQNTETQGNLVVEEIDRALGIVGEDGLGTTGMLAPLTSLIGGTRAGDLDSLLTTIRSNIGFDQLQRMREASPTGGALGQVTERELTELQAVAGSLEQSQSGEQLTFNLIRLRNRMLDAVHGPGNGPARIDPNNMNPGRGSLAADRQGGAQFTPQQILNLSPQELSTLDLNELSAEQLDAYLQATESR